MSSPHRLRFATGFVAALPNGHHLPKTVGVGRTMSLPIAASEARLLGDNGADGCGGGQRFACAATGRASRRGGAATAPLVGHEGGLH